MTNKPKSFLNKTSYPGGIKALRDFIDHNLRYPEEAIKQKVSGTVSLTFDIDYKGKISNIKIKHKIGYGCDEEAIRLVKLMKFSSTKNRGLYVVFHETLNIVFDLKKFIEREEKKALAKTEQNNKNKITAINYTLTPNSGSKTTEQPITGKHTYTIKIN